MNQSSYENEAWFKGSMSREDAEQYLKTHTTTASFLVRNSSTPGVLCVSVRLKLGTFSHTLIAYTPQLGWTIEQKEANKAVVAPSLRAMLEQLGYLKPAFLADVSSTTSSTSLNNMNNNINSNNNNNNNVQYNGGGGSVRSVAQYVPITVTNNNNVVNYDAVAPAPVEISNSKRGELRRAAAEKGMLPASRMNNTNSNNNVASPPPSVGGGGAGGGGGPSLPPPLVPVPPPGRPQSYAAAVQMMMPPARPMRGMNNGPTAMSQAARGGSLRGGGGMAGVMMMPPPSPAASPVNINNNNSNVQSSYAVLPVAAAGTSANGPPPPIPSSVKPTSVNNNVPPLTSSSPSSPVVMFEQSSTVPSTPPPHNQYTVVPQRVSASDDEAWRVDPTEVAVGEVIGRGNFGVVLRGEWRGMQVAIKRMVLDLADLEPKQRADFARECAVLAKLRPHRNLVAFLGLTVLEGHDAILLDFCGGGSLETALLDPAGGGCDWSLDDKLAIAHDCAAGLTHLHREGIVHRDIAARNVLLDSFPFIAKLSDFGMSRVVQDRAADHFTATRVGPARWSAPEMIEKGAFSVRSDVFMFAVLLYEIFERQKPWANLDPTTAAFEVLSGRRMTLTSNVPTRVADVMRACWSHEPTARPRMEETLTQIKSAWTSLHSGRQ